ncbi:MAG: hypothetical protein BGO98_32595 [Myxococcales bacterium 68-20]|nr:hypothetical protein [Myxococcales bacterium]OJY18475.1 MAG: hypothetical protein BGO98_32595 [Myxococcales bacterium 68-20]
MKAWLGGSLFASIAVLYACVGSEPVFGPNGEDAGASNDAAVLESAAPATLQVEATPRVFVPPNVATDVKVTITRTGFDGPVKIEIDKLPDGVTADGAPTIAAGQTTATIRLSTSSSTQAFSRAKITATFEGANPIMVSTDVEVTLRGKSGEADTTFGAAGVVDLASSNVGESIMDAIADNEGRIYLLLPDLGDPKKCRVFRTTPNGAIDASGWGTNGIVDFRRPGDTPIFCVRLALQADGKVLVGGNDDLGGAGNVAWVARVSGTATNGSFLDTTYGAGGFALTNGTAVFGVTVDAKERALVRGHTGSSNYVRRVSTSGTIDNTFTLTSSAVLDTLAGALVATASGAIYGTRQGGSDVFRLSETGSLDTTFGNTGFLAVPKPADAVEAELNGFRLDSKGRIVGIGKTDFDDTVGGVVVRLDGDKFDTTFGPDHNGMAYVKGSHDLQYLNAVVDETDGIIAASNEQRSPTDTRVVLTRFVDGTVDSIFSPGGTRSLPAIGGIADVRGLVLQEQRVLVLLFVQLDGKFHPILARLWR